MKKILTLTLLLVFLCALTLTFTACSFFATADPIVGNYCGQVDFNTSKYAFGQYAYLTIAEQDGELVVTNYWLFEHCETTQGKETIAIEKISNNGDYKGDLNDTVKFLTLTKSDTSYTATAKCNMLDNQTSESTFTYTLTLDNGTLTIVCKDDVTSESQTYTLNSTTKKNTSTIFKNLTTL